MLQDVTSPKGDLVLMSGLLIPRRILSEFGIYCYKMLQGIITCYKMLEVLKRLGTNFRVAFSKTYFSPNMGYAVQRCYKEL